MLPLAFTTPLMLTALAVLPALWLLLRLVPPRPQRVIFPPLRLLLGLGVEEETPARTPWWLLLLRLGLAALVILMLAGPVWRPQPVAAGSGPLLLMVDNGWASGGDWERRRAAADERVAAADAGRRPVALVGLAERPSDISLVPAAAAREALRALVPQPWAPDRAAHLPSLGAFLTAHDQADVIWISDGLATAAADPFTDGLRPMLGGHTLDVLESRAATPLALAGAANEPSALTVRVLRSTASGLSAGTTRAFDSRGLPLGEVLFTFAGTALETQARFELPVDLRNDVARIEVTGEHQAGAVQLLDERYRRRTVGVVSGETADTAQPLLSSSYYLGRALQPFADVRTADGLAAADAVARFIADRLPVIVLADVGTLGGQEQALDEWVRRGGMLIRFAGSRLAAAGDALVPVTLRGGGRTLGGALSWEKPQGLGAFPDGSPFAGLPVPTDVTVTRQVLAEPDADLPGKIWAQLGDGTPLVTATRRGQGLLALVHVTADTTWSNLPLSGTFVDMLRRMVALSGPAGAPRAAAGGATAPVAMVSPSRTLDGFGVLRSPPAGSEPIRADQPGVARLVHPPGFYGPPDGLVAVNTLPRDAKLIPLAYGTLARSISGLATVQPLELGTPLLVAALILLMLDAVLVLVMNGGAQRLRRFAGASAAVLAIGLLALSTPRPAWAQDAPVTPYDATLRTHLAYVVTGNAEADEASRAGLRGLTAFLADRTALEPGDPLGIDLDRDELSFEPLLYWPIVAGAPVPPAATLAKIDSFMRSGGLIIFDTRDALEQGATLGSTPAGASLQQILSQLDVPELEPVPRNHVLTKTFFLLDTFPGRYDSGKTWVQVQPADLAEADRPAVAGDGVSPLIITSNDLAGAWAVDDTMQPLYPTSPGGERQREYAYRSGVNIVMYALTGNYKADQVHVPALLERLGQ